MTVLQKSGKCEQERGKAQELTQMPQFPWIALLLPRTPKATKAIRAQQGRLSDFAQKEDSSSTKISEMNERSDVATRNVALPDFVIHKEMCRLGAFAKNEDWDNVLKMLVHNPDLALERMPSGSSILHRAILSKGPINSRLRVMRRILRTTPQTARLKNCFGSLPIHLICTGENRKSQEIREDLIKEVARSFPDGLVTPGGKEHRTPLHSLLKGERT